MELETTAKYFYVYDLQSEKDQKLYTGYSSNLRRRLKEHMNGEVISTRNRLPIRLIYWEGCLNRTDATRREKYLKTAWGKRYIKNRIKNYLTGETQNNQVIYQ